MFAADHVVQLSGMNNPEHLPTGIVPGDEAKLRSGPTDREAAVDRLQSAAAEGRIDLTALADRLGQAYSSRTYGELDALLADLPAPFQVSWPMTTTLVLQTTA